jgi:voltage-gated potassium channel
MNVLRQHIYNTLEVSAKKQSVSWYFDILLTTVIALNALAIAFQSIKEIGQQYHALFEAFELFSIMLFSVEYFLRVWACIEDSRFSEPVKGRVKFMLTPLALIDLLSILPFYILLFAVDLRYLRILRLFRIFRLFKIVRYVSALNTIAKVVREKKDQLIISSVFTLFLLFLVSNLMYHIENETQPDAFSSIPETMWWGVATLTTVGYGDVYPITPTGKLLVGIISILGIGLFALPAGILASGFSETFNTAEDKPAANFCSHCGESIYSKDL